MFRSEEVRLNCSDEGKNLLPINFYKNSSDEKEEILSLSLIKSDHIFDQISHHSRLARATYFRKLLLSVPCHEVESVLWKEPQRRRRIINLAKVQRLIAFSRFLDQVLFRYQGDRPSSSSTHYDPPLEKHIICQDNQNILTKSFTQNK